MAFLLETGGLITWKIIEILLLVMSFISDNIFLEQKVDAILSMSVDPAKEHLQRGVLIGVLLADAFLPDGCKRLGIKVPTVVEVKKRLIADSVYRISMSCEQWARDNHGKILIIYEEKQEKINWSKVGYPPFLQIEHFDEFYKRLTNRTEDYINGITGRSWTEDTNQSLAELTKIVHHKDCSLFLGAGVSKSAEAPSWDELLKSLYLRSIGCHDFREPEEYNSISKINSYSALITARYVTQGIQNVDGEIKSIIYDGTQETSPLIRAIVNMVKDVSVHVSSIISYNYDDLVDMALEKAGVDILSVYGNNRAESFSTLPIYHVHGLIPRTRKIQSTPILNEKDYHKIYQENYHWSNVEQLHALSRKTCIFIGLSMTDPNLRRLIEFSRRGSEAGMYHYVFLQRFETEGVSHEFNCECCDRYQKMMGEMGVNVIWYKKHEELPAILSSLYSEERNVITE